MEQDQGLARPIGALPGEQVRFDLAWRRVGRRVGHQQDAVGLPQAAFGPRGGVAIGLVHDVPVVALVLGEPLHEAAAIAIGHLRGTGCAECGVHARAGQVQGRAGALEGRHQPGRDLAKGHVRRRRHDGNRDHRRIHAPPARHVVHARHHASRQQPQHGVRMPLDEPVERLAVQARQLRVPHRDDRGRPGSAAEVRHLADHLAGAQLGDDAGGAVGLRHDDGHASAHEQVDGMPCVALPEQHLAAIERHGRQRRADLAEQSRVHPVEGRALVQRRHQPLPLEMGPQILVQAQRRGRITTGEPVQGRRRDHGDRRRAARAQRRRCRPPRSRLGLPGQLSRADVGQGSLHTKAIGGGSRQGSREHHGEMRHDIVLAHDDLAISERGGRRVCGQHLQAGVGHVCERREAAEDLRQRHGRAVPALSPAATVRM